MLTVHAEDDRLLELYFHAMLAAGHYLARRGFIALSFEIDDSHCERLVADTRLWGETLRGTIPQGTG